MFLTFSAQRFYFVFGFGDNVGPLILLTWLIWLGGTLNESNFGGDMALINYL
jgi:hypothetical protein